MAVAITANSQSSSLRGHSLQSSQSKVNNQSKNVRTPKLNKASKGTATKVLRKSLFRSPTINNLCDKTIEEDSIVKEVRSDSESASESEESDTISFKSLTCKNRIKQTANLKQTQLYSYVNLKTPGVACNTSSTIAINEAGSIGVTVYKSAENVTQQEATIDKSDNITTDTDSAVTAEVSKEKQKRETAINSNQLHHLYHNATGHTAEMTQNGDPTQDPEWKTMLQGIQTTLNEIQTERKNDLRIIQNFESGNSKLTQDVADLKMQVSGYQAQVSKLRDVFIRQDLMSKECKSEMEQIQFHNMKLNLVIHGIERHSKEKCKEKVDNFFKNTMEITDKIEFEQAFRLGKSVKAPILVILKNFEQRVKIFSHVKNLTDKPYSIDVQLPPRMKEAK